jgi:hypothetical protein
MGRGPSKHNEIVMIYISANFCSFLGSWMGNMTGGISGRISLQFLPALYGTRWMMEKREKRCVRQSTSELKESIPMLNRNYSGRG